MDIQREIFEKWFKKAMYHKHLKENFWDVWKQAQKQAIPDGYVLVEKSEIESLCDFACEAKQYTTDSFTEIKYIEKELQAVIEAQEQTHE